MSKDFDGWNEQKKVTHNGAGRFYHEREVWWCSLGVNVGFEQDRRGYLFQRPVLIVRGLSSHTCIVAPFTTSSGDNHPMRIQLGKVGEQEAYAIISQLRVIDTRRFTERLAVLNKGLFAVVQKAVKKLF